MRTIERTGALKRDYKRGKSTPRHREIETDLRLVLNLLVVYKPCRKSIAIIRSLASGKTIGIAT